MTPLGFTDEEQFAEATRRFRTAADVEDALVGIRGSTSTGQSAQNGTAFGPESDLDFFLVSAELGRKTTVRIFSQAGYDLVKAATDIVGE